jgi:excisionase family DNA binding protein
MKGRGSGAQVGAPETTAEPQLLTTSEAARRAGVTRATISGWIRGGQLPASLVGHWRRIRPSDLAAVQSTAHVGIVVPAWRQDRQRCGSRLRALREAAGRSQVELAAASGLTHEAISRLELGQRAPQAETVRKLAAALRVDPQQFVDYAPLGLTALPVAEAAARLGVPAGRLQTWLRQGLFDAAKVSGQWRVSSVVVAELGRSGRLRGRSRRLDPRYRG